jgi:hypothetical protein
MPTSSIRVVSSSPAAAAAPAQVLLTRRDTGHTRRRSSAAGLRSSVLAVVRSKQSPHHRDHRRPTLPPWRCSPLLRIGSTRSIKSLIFRTNCIRKSLPAFNTNSVLADVVQVCYFLRGEFASSENLNAIGFLQTCREYDVVRCSIPG